MWIPPPPPRGRKPKPRRLTTLPIPRAWVPSPPGAVDLRYAVILGFDEFEAYKLVYYDELTQEKAAETMGVSRGTLWRLLSSARKKIAIALVEVKPIVISPLAR